MFTLQAQWRVGDVEGGVAGGLLGSVAVRGEGGGAVRREVRGEVGVVGGGVYIIVLNKITLTQKKCTYLYHIE